MQAQQGLLLVGFVSCLSLDPSGQKLKWTWTGMAP